MDTEQAVTSNAADYREVLARTGFIIALIGVPFMILLMYCAWLPVMMGMYFFILGGLLLGGIWYRMARRIRPAPGQPSMPPFSPYWHSGSSSTSVPNTT